VRGKRSRVRIELRRKDGRLLVIARGRINPRAEESSKHRLADGSIYAATTLRRALLDFGSP